MRTVIETPIFQKQATSIWSKDEREAFIDWIAQNPNAGDIIQNSQGARKVRWARKGTGKSGGARIIYYHLVDDEVVLLLTVYAKAVQESISAKEIKDKRSNHENPQRPKKPRSR